MNDVACIDLFCGAGGLTHGLHSSGIRVVAGIDIDEACRYPFDINNEAKFIKNDVKSLSSEDIHTLYGDARIRVLAGCAPCQPFSNYAHRYDMPKNLRWSLINHFSRLVSGIKPELVTMENVPSVVNHDVFKKFIGNLTKLGYYLYHDIIDCSLYGLPQTRRRLVLLASLLGPISLIPSQNKNKSTVRDAIGKLPPISNGESHNKDPLHVASKLSPLNLARIQASRPGGTWRDWPKHLIAECHRRDTGSTYPSVYGRMTWDKPAPTLTTQFFGFGNGRFGHPTQDRAISLREGMIFQGFPKNYAFVPEGSPTNIRELGRMIGNAVPVTLGKVIGKSISSHLGLKIRAVCS